MMFADDLLMFCKAEKTSVESMGQVLEKFFAASGLSANKEKSCVYLTGVSHQIREEIIDCQGMVEGTFPFRYLGIPLHTKKLSITEGQGLINKVTHRIKGWTARLLSYPGRLELVRTVIGGLTNFWGLIFCIPKKVMREIQRLCSNFL